MRFSYSAVWDDTMALLRAHGTLMAAIAGVFIFFPALLLSFFLPPPTAPASDPGELFQMIGDYYRANAGWFLAEGLLAMVGTLSIQRLIFARETTVSAAIVNAVSLLPFYILVSLIGGLVIGFGLMLLLLPGLYLMARLVVASPLMVAEQRRNPIEVLAGSFRLTRKRGWAILGMLALVAIAGLIVTRVAIMLIGIVIALLTGGELERLLLAIVTSAVGAAFAVVLTVLYAAIYRALVRIEQLAGGSASTAQVFE